MKKTKSGAVALLACLPLQTVMAQDLSAEVSPSTVWFALLVVLFALLVSVGIFMARDTEEEPEPMPLRKSKLHKRVPSPNSQRRKQQEFS